MSFPEETIDVDATCQYLGLADDADSHATYATEAHRCYKLPNPTRIATGHQESYCLGANHPNCPVFQGEAVPQSRPPAAAAAMASPEAGPPVTAPAGAARGQRRTPPPGQRRRQPGGTLGPRPRAGGISMPAATIGLFALAIALVALAFLIQRALSGGGDNNLSAADTFATQQALHATQTSEAGGGGQTQPAGQTQTTTASQTPGAGETATTQPNATNTPSGGGSGSTYTVQSGDTCGAIATRFDTTVEAIIAANDLNDACDIFVEQVLTIP